MVREYTRRCNTLENIHEVIGDPRPRQVYGFLSDQQSKYNWILVLFFIFPGDISDVFISLLPSDLNNKTYQT